MESNILSRPILEMLAAFEKVLRQFGNDFYLVGALARDIRLSANPNYEPKRRTKDVDIAILINSEEEFYQIKGALLATGDFSAHPTESIKLLYKQAIELDILPFGEIENQAREIRLEKPRLFVIDVPGFMEILPAAEEFSLDDKLKLKICSLEGIILLKIIANDDKPSRTKDISDIEYIISVYFELCEKEIFGKHEDSAELYGTADRNYLSLVSARVIGREIAVLLKGSASLKERLLNIVDRKTSAFYWPAIADGMRDKAP